MISTINNNNIAVLYLQNRIIAVYSIFIPSLYYFYLREREKTDFVYFFSFTFFIIFVHGEIREVINRSKSKSKHRISSLKNYLLLVLYIPGRNSCHRGSTFSGTKQNERKKERRRRSDGKKRRMRVTRMKRPLLPLSV